jgi:hypothetical protein
MAGSENGSVSNRDAKSALLRSHADIETMKMD